MVISINESAVENRIAAKHAKPASHEQIFSLEQPRDGVLKRISNMHNDKLKETAEFYPRGPAGFEKPFLVSPKIGQKYGIDNAPGAQILLTGGGEPLLKLEKSATQVLKKQVTMGNTGQQTSKVWTMRDQVSSTGKITRTSKIHGEGESPCPITTKHEPRSEIVELLLQYYQ